MLNEALNDIDSATDVVVPHKTLERQTRRPARGEPQSGTRWDSARRRKNGTRDRRMDRHRDARRRRRDRNPCRHRPAAECRRASRWRESRWPPTCSIRCSTAAACAGFATREASRRRSRATTRAPSSPRISRKARSASCSAAASPRCAGASMRRTAGASSQMLDGSRTRASPTIVAFSVRVGEPIRMRRGRGHRRVVDDGRAGRLHRRGSRMCSPGSCRRSTLSILLRTTHRDTRTLLTTYLGRTPRNACSRAISCAAGPSRSGRWSGSATLPTSREISDTASPDTVLALLNDYAQEQVEEIEAHGGNVLKFIGDGILAIFPDADTTLACARALDAAAKMRQRIAELNVRRAASGLPVTDTQPGPARRRTPLRQSGRPAAARLHRAGIGGQRGGTDRGAMPLTRPEGHRVLGVRRGGRRSAQSAREPRPLRDEGRRPAPGIVHAGSRVGAGRLQYLPPVLPV